MRLLAFSAALALLASTALAGGINCSSGSNCDPHASGNGTALGQYSSNQAATNAEQIAKLLAINEAASKARAESSSKASSDVRNVVTTEAKGGKGGQGGRAVSDQTQRQTATGGSATQSARTGDVSVTVDQSNRARIPVATALAPDLIIQGGERCYWTFSIVGAAQSTTGGGSAGAGLFPTRLKTCMLFELADRYAAGYGDNPEALRLLREIEASLD